MLVLPRQPLDRSSGLLDLGRGGNSVFGPAAFSRTLLGFVVAILLMIFLLLIWPILYFSLRRMTKNLTIFPSYYEDNSTVGQITPSVYAAMRKHRDKVAKIKAGFSDTNGATQLPTPYLRNTLLTLLRVCNEQIYRIDTILARLDQGRGDIAGFKSISQDTLWANRPKAYAYRL